MYLFARQPSLIAARAGLVAEGLLNDRRRLKGGSKSRQTLLPMPQIDQFGGNELHERDRVVSHEPSALNRDKLSVVIVVLNCAEEFLVTRLGTPTANVMLSKCCQID